MLNLSDAILIPNLDDVIYFRPIVGLSECTIDVRFKNGEKITVSYGADKEKFVSDVKNILNKYTNKNEVTTEPKRTTRGKANG